MREGRRASRALRAPRDAFKERVRGEGRVSHVRIPPLITVTLFSQKKESGAHGWTKRPFVVAGAVGYGLVLTYVVTRLPFASPRQPMKWMVCM